MASKSPWGGGLGWKASLIGGLLAALLLFIAVTASLNAYNYSIGRRTGTIDKISTKGLFCWTMEGQLAMPNFSQSGSLSQNSGTLDNTFYFSVPDKAIQKQLEALPPGSPVSLEYHQKLFPLSLPLPFLCHRRTEYEIVGVKLAPAYAPPTAAPLRP
jgi:hypothetical protein